VATIILPGSRDVSNFWGASPKRTTFDRFFPVLFYDKMFVLLTTKLQPYEAAIPSRAGAQWARSVKNVKKHQT
jgi:hypothetical protein